MIRRHRALPAVARELTAVDVSKHLVIRSMRKHEVLPGLADEASQHRCDVGGRREYLWQLHGECTPLPHSSQRPLCQTNQIDHAVVGFACVGAEREDPVLMQNQSFALRMGVENLFGFSGQREAWHHVGYDGGARSIDLPAKRHAVRPVAQRENGIGMRMVDEFVGDERMQQGFDRRIGCGAVEQVGPLNRNHLIVVQGF